LGIVLFNAGQRDAAFEELRHAAKDDPALEAPALTMGWLHTRDRELKKADEWMAYAAKLAPDSKAVRLGVATWLLEQGRGDEARTHAEAAAKLDPKDNDTQRVLALIARQRKEYPRAEAILQPMSVATPGDAWVRNQLAAVLIEQADEAKRLRALELAELSVRQDPNAAAALTTLGLVYDRLKRLDDAAKVLQAVLKSGRGNSDAAYLLARVQAERGHPENAPALLKSALAAPGLFLFRNEAQQWLDRLTTTASSK
jgi:predicted Zn-dependent protease